MDSEFIFCNSDFSPISEFISQLYFFCQEIKNEKVNCSIISHNSDVFTCSCEFLSHNIYAGFYLGLFFSELWVYISNCKIKISD